MFGLTALPGLIIYSTTADAIWTLILCSVLPLMFADELISLHEFPREVGLTTRLDISIDTGIR